MAIAATSSDFIGWSGLLKGNYRKGVHRAREIMANRSQAEAFCSNPGAMAIVLGHDPGMPDANSEELRRIVLESGHVDTAVGAMVESAYGVGVEEFCRDRSRIEDALSDPARALAVKESDAVFAKCLCTMSGSDPSGVGSLGEFIASDAYDTSLADERSMGLMADSARMLIEVAGCEAGRREMFFDAAPPSVEDRISCDADIAAAYAGNMEFGRHVADKYEGSFETCPWGEVSRIAALAKIVPDAFSSYVGKKRTVKIPDDYRNPDINVRDNEFTVCGVGFDGCGFTFISMRTHMSHQYYGEVTGDPLSSTSPRWDECTLRMWLKDGVFGALPEDLRAVVKTVRKTTYAGYLKKDIVTDEKLWIPSAHEVNLDDEGNQATGGYALFKDNASRIMTSPSGTNKEWWIRSSRGPTASAKDYINSSGRLNTTNSTKNYCVAACFCV